MITITAVAWQKAVIFISFHSQVAREDNIIAHSKSLHVSWYSNIIFSLHSSICWLNLKSLSVAVGVLYSFFPAFRDQMKHPHTGDNFHVSHIPCCSQSIIFNASLYCLRHQLQQCSIVFTCSASQMHRIQHPAIGFTPLLYKIVSSDKHNEIENEQ